MSGDDIMFYALVAITTVKPGDDAHARCLAIADKALSDAEEAEDQDASATPSQRLDAATVERWQTGRDVPKVEQRHKDAAAWAMDRSPDGLTWDMATAAHVTPDRRWQMNRVAEAMARMERAALATEPHQHGGEGA